MAVKQNNSEGNSSAADASQANGGNGVKSIAGTITKSKSMTSNGTNGEGGGAALSAAVTQGSGGTTELPGCSGNTGASSKTKFVTSPSNIGSSSGNAVAGQNTITAILHYIDFIEMNQQQIDSNKNMTQFHRYIIVQLAKVQPPKNLKQFKEDMVKVGLFFENSTEKKQLFFSYLEIICHIITMADSKIPSCALAIIFNLFNPKMIFEAVKKLLDFKISDQNIRKIVFLLCEWLPICNFCQNLHVWIVLILNGLLERKESNLVEQIALENIERLFQSLMIPVSRPKVAPVVFCMLSSIDQNPEVFYKILPKYSTVIHVLKQQPNTESAKKVLEQLVDRTFQLMARFHRYDDMYEPIELALKGLQPSNNFMNYACSLTTQNNNAKVGLANLGNTCYMNSVLQALAMTKEFSREILLCESKSPLLIKMQQQIALMLYSTRQELTPSKVLNATRPPGFSAGLQQDSSEFLGYLLETLHEQEVNFRTKTLKSLQKCGDEETTIKEDNSLENGASALCNDDEDENEADEHGIDDNCCKRNISDAADSTKSTNLQNNKTATLSSSVSLSSKSTLTKASISAITQTSTVEKTFTGKLATTYKCLTCGWKSSNIDSFRDLQLSFPDVKNDCASNYSVQDLIEYYCSSEKLFGDNQYFCERCKKLSDAERYINVISAPKNLILTLKHFKYDQKYHMRAKLMHKVFHDEKVSLKVCSPEKLEEIATVHYDLYAGVVHSGFSMDSGHYYTYAADASNKWYKFNDSIVTPSRTEELHNLTPPNTPYILFYQMGARSNDTPETSASTKVIKVDVPIPLTLEELPSELRDMVAHDNLAFSEELKLRRFKNVSSLNANTMKTNDQRRDSFEDEDDEQQLSTQQLYW